MGLRFDKNQTVAGPPDLSSRIAQSRAKEIQNDEAFDCRVIACLGLFKRMRMKDGVVMEGKDGQKYPMKNDAIWKQVAEKGTLAPNR